MMVAMMKAMNPIWNKSKNVFHKFKLKYMLVHYWMADRLKSTNFPLFLVLRILAIYDWQDIFRQKLWLRQENSWVFQAIQDCIATRTSVNFKGTATNVNKKLLLDVSRCFRSRCGSWRWIGSIRWKRGARAGVQSGDSRYLCKQKL